MVLLVQFHAHAQGILLAELAEGGSRTGAHRADTHAHSRTLFKSQILPCRINVLFLESYNGNSGGSGKLEGFGLVFFSHISNFSEHFRCNNPAGNVRGNGIGLVVILEDGSLFAKFEHMVYPYYKS